MSHVINNKNAVTLAGIISSNIVFDYEFKDKKYYSATIMIKRTSNNEDFIPLLISEELIDFNKDYNGKFVKIYGSINTYNNIQENGKTKLKVSVYVKSIDILDGEENEFHNNVILEGYIGSPVKCRKTPLNKIIGDFTLAVNRLYGKCNYIPCICWYDNAVFASKLPLGAYVTVSGRIQSREYVKKISDTESENRVAYEMSISEIKELGKQE